MIPIFEKKFNLFNDYYLLDHNIIILIIRIANFMNCILI